MNCKGFHWRHKSNLVVGARARPVSVAMAVRHRKETRLARLHTPSFPVSLVVSRGYRIEFLSYLIILEMFGAAATTACWVNDVRETVCNAVLVSS